MSSGRLFLDRVARQHCPSPLSPARPDYHAPSPRTGKTGHFYFAGNRTFLLCLDIGEVNPRVWSQVSEVLSPTRLRQGRSRQALHVPGVATSSMTILHLIQIRRPDYPKDTEGRSSRAHSLDNSATSIKPQAQPALESLSASDLSANCRMLSIGGVGKIEGSHHVVNRFRHQRFPVFTTCDAAPDLGCRDLIVRAVEHQRMDVRR